MSHALTKHYDITSHTPYIRCLHNRFLMLTDRLSSISQLSHNFALVSLKKISFHPRTHTPPNVGWFTLWATVSLSVPDLGGRLGYSRLAQSYRSDENVSNTAFRQSFNHVPGWTVTYVHVCWQNSRSWSRPLCTLPVQTGFTALQRYSQNKTSWTLWPNEWKYCEGNNKCFVTWRDRTPLYSGTLTAPSSGFCQSRHILIISLSLYRNICAS